MNKGLSRRIREIAQEKYVLPALRAGAPAFSLRVRDLMDDLKKEGFSTQQNTPQFCSAIRKTDFLTDNGLEITGIDGPPSKQSTTVVVHYRVISAGGNASRESTGNGGPADENSPSRAKRLTDKLRGLLKDELKEYGGAEGFIRWIRSDEDDAA